MWQQWQIERQKDVFSFGLKQTSATIRRKENCLEAVSCLVSSLQFGLSSHTQCKSTHFPQSCATYIKSHIQVIAYLLKNATKFPKVVLGIGEYTNENTHTRTNIYRTPAFSFCTVLCGWLNTALMHNAHTVDMKCVNRLHSSVTVQLIVFHTAWRVSVRPVGGRSSNKQFLAFRINSSSLMIWGGIIATTAEVFIEQENKQNQNIFNKLISFFKKIFTKLE